MTRRTAKHSRGASFISPISPKNPPRWNLADLLSHPSKNSEIILKQVDQLVTRLESSRKFLTPQCSDERFLRMLRLTDEIVCLSSRLSAFAQLWFAENTKNQAARAFKAEVRERLTKYANRILFFDLWWQELTHRQSLGFLRQAGKYRYHLETLSRLKNHTLSENEERIVNLKNSLKNSTGRSAIDRFYDVCTNSFSHTIHFKKKVQPLTKEALSVHFRSPSPQLREKAYSELFRAYSANQDVLGELYKSLVLDWKIEGLDLREYKTPIAVRNLANDIPDQAVQTFLKTCRKNAHIFQEYFQIKAKICRIKRMSRFHIYAPPQGTKARYSFTKAVQIVFEAYQRFSPTMTNLAQRVFTDQHLDARTYSGKSGRGFCYSVLPEFTPYVY